MFTALGCGIYALVVVGAVLYFGFALLSVFGGFDGGPMDTLASTLPKLMIVPAAFSLVGAWRQRKAKKSDTQAA
jgi:hypothetical protein